MPYSTRPGRLLAQLSSDFAVIAWTALWLLVGLAVYDAISTIADAGHNLQTTASWLALLLAMAVVALPILIAVLPWLFLRLRFFRRKWIVTALAATPAGGLTWGCDTTAKLGVPY